ncbi:MAG: hypothetical protein AAFX90_10025 [Pseudomonadota bacterium]
MSETFTIKRGDTSPGIKYQLTLASDQTLVGAGALFKMKGINDDTAKVNASATVDDVNNILTYDWDLVDTDTADIFEAEFEVTYADTKKETFPNDGYLQIEVVADLD